jgi:L-asparaginase / beta-aspartyl-peptidase
MKENNTRPIALAIHGGCGTLQRAAMSDEREKLYHLALEQALRAGYACLVAGASALDAVEACVVVLEDSPLFNAGRGSVMTHDGKHEMDAAIMSGERLEAGAVAGVRGLKNPVLAARKVLESGTYVMLAGPGAEAFAREQGLSFEPDSYFFTQERMDQLTSAKAGRAMVMDHDGSAKKFGTVGAVAVDRRGHVAAATSTGGLTNKRFGRVGDTPVIGSGTWADNRSCAISCTGYGEAFIRLGTARAIASRVQLLGEDLLHSCDVIVNQELPRYGGEGGVIALDPAGRICLAFNTEGMYRAWCREGEPMQTAIFR